MNSSTDTAGLSPMTLVLVAAMIVFMLLGKGGCGQTSTPASWGGLANPFHTSSLGLPAMP